MSSSCRLNDSNEQLVRVAEISLGFRDLMRLVLASSMSMALLHRELEWVEIISAAFVEV